MGKHQLHFLQELKINLLLAHGRLGAQAEFRFDADQSICNFVTCSVG